MCQIEGCDAKPIAKGLCAKHYMRVRRHGDANSRANAWHEGLCRWLAHGDHDQVARWLAAQVPRDRLVAALSRAPEPRPSGTRPLTWHKRGDHTFDARAPSGVCYRVMSMSAGGFAVLLYPEPGHWDNVEQLAAVGSLDEGKAFAERHRLSVG